MISESALDCNFYNNMQPQHENDYFAKAYDGNQVESFSYCSTDFGYGGPTTHADLRDYGHQYTLPMQHRPLQDITSQHVNRAPVGYDQNFSYFTSDACAQNSYAISQPQTETRVWQQSDENSYNSTYQHHRLRTNRRKRERNMNINYAFDSLKNRIPNLPNDTKISKIRILQLACEYIRHLDETLQEGDKNCNVEATVINCEPSPPIDPSTTFNVRPNLVRGKRKRIDWDRIQDEIQRHESNNTSKRRNTSSETNSSTHSSVEEISI